MRRDGFAKPVASGLEGYRCQIARGAPQNLLFKPQINLLQNVNDVVVYSVLPHMANGRGKFRNLLQLRNHNQKRKSRYLFAGLIERSTL